MTTQAMFLGLGGLSAVMAVIAALREKKRAARPNLDQVGWVPWNFLQILFGIVTVVALVLAFKLK